jgi:thymidylate kinase
MLITFSGLDGSGKSTLIRSARAALEARGADLVVRHMTYDVGIFALAIGARNLLRRAIGKSGGERRVSSEPRRLQSRWQRLRYAMVWNKSLRRMIYLADLAIFAGYRLYAERLRGRVLIMDRYFYDTLVDVTGPGGPGWTRALAWITPAPDLALLLDTGPEEAFARKGEYSIEYLARRWAAYQQVFSGVPSAVVLDNRDLARATGEIARLAVERGLPIAVGVTGTSSMHTGGC